MADDNDFDMHVIPASKRLLQWGYNYSTGQAKAVFLNGSAAVYEGVPPEVFDAVLKAPSVGTEFGALIVNGGYSFEYV